MSDLPHLMVDIETLGLEPGAPILSIGAVRFSRDRVSDGRRWSVSLSSCEAHGLTGFDADTLAWWLRQDRDLQCLISGGEPLPEVLAALAEYGADAETTWACSPKFDMGHLEAAYERVDPLPPWCFSALRDVRTVREVVGVDLDRAADEQPAHDALADARHQARVVQTALRRIDAGAEVVADE